MVLGNTNAEISQVEYSTLAPCYSLDFKVTVSFWNFQKQRFFTELWLFNPIRGRGGGFRPPSTFLYLAQKPLYLINRRLSTFPIYLLGLRICKKNCFGYGVCAHLGHDQILKLEKGYKNSTFCTELAEMHNSFDF